MRLGTCATCTFFQDVHKECRYNPPTLVVRRAETNPNLVATLPAAYTSKWPSVDSDDWCAHYRSAIVRGQRKTWNHQLNDGDVEVPHE